MDSHTWMQFGIDLHVFHQYPKFHSAIALDVCAANLKGRDLSLEVFLEQFPLLSLRKEIIYSSLLIRSQAKTLLNDEKGLLVSKTRSIHLNQNSARKKGQYSHHSPIKHHT